MICGQQLLGDHQSIEKKNIKAKLVKDTASKLMFIEDAYNHLQPGDPGPP